MSNLRKVLRCINYDKSSNVFKKEYQKRFHHMFAPNENLLRKDLRKLNKENRELNAYNKYYANIYFHDIPKDMYRQMGLKIDDNYKTINDVYWRFFISGVEMKDNNEKHASLTDGDKETNDDEHVKRFRTFEQILYILLAVVVMIFIVGVINDVIKKIVINRNAVDVHQ